MIYPSAKIDDAPFSPAGHWETSASRPIFGRIKTIIASPMIGRGKAIVGEVLKSTFDRVASEQSNFAGLPSTPSTGKGGISLTEEDSSSSLDATARDDRPHSLEADASAASVASADINVSTAKNEIDSSMTTNNPTAAVEPTYANTPSNTDRRKFGAIDTAFLSPVEPAPTQTHTYIRRGSSNEVIVADDKAEREKSRIRDRRVPYGICVVSKTPSVNTLRYPLTILAKRSDIWNMGVGGNESAEAVREHQQPVEESTGGAGDEERNHQGQVADESTGSVQRAHAFLHMLEEEDILRPIRQATSNSPRNPIPTVLRPGGAQDIDCDTIFRALNPRNIVTVLVAFMLEFKIAVVSSKVTSLTVLGELLKVLISPLRWSHIYVPVLPKNMSGELLQCPTPFFVGLLRENFDASVVPSDVCLLDLENDACRVPPALSKTLYAGRRLSRSLDQLMRPSLYKCDDVDYVVPKCSGGIVEASGERSADVAFTSQLSKKEDPDHGQVSSGGSLSRNILRLCKSFVADVLEGVDECSVHCVDHSELVVLFDEAMFVAHKQRRSKYSEFPAEKMFLDQLVRTQCFSMCVAGSILKRLNPDSRPTSRPSSPFVALSPLQDLDSSDIPFSPQYPL